jgi:hypothetical protein
MRSQLQNGSARDPRRREFVIVVQCNSTEFIHFREAHLPLRQVNSPLSLRNLDGSSDGGKQ